MSWFGHVRAMTRQIYRNAQWVQYKWQNLIGNKPWDKLAFRQFAVSLGMSIRSIQWAQTHSQIIINHSKMWQNQNKKEHKRKRKPKNKAGTSLNSCMSSFIKILQFLWHFPKQCSHNSRRTIEQYHSSAFKVNAENRENISFHSPRRKISFDYFSFEID